MRHGIVTFGALAALAFAPPSFAQSKQSFNALVGQGYEIKAVTPGPPDTAQGGDPNVKMETVAVTLQKEKSVAVCYYFMSSWTSLNPDSLNNANQCEVR